MQSAFKFCSLSPINSSGLRSWLDLQLTSSIEFLFVHYHPIKNIHYQEFVRFGIGAFGKGRRIYMKMASLNGENAASSSTMEEKQEEEEIVVQYVVVRRDLIDTWPLGSVITQGCHASVAAIWEHKHDATTLRYCSPPALDSMHKVTLEVKGETQLVNLSEKLKANGILHKLWIEQPENFPTCLATKPYPKSVVSPFFRKLKLCK